jgi:hypothetical protein
LNGREEARSTTFGRPPSAALVSHWQLCKHRAIRTAAKCTPVAETIHAHLKDVPEERPMRHSWRLFDSCGAAPLSQDQFANAFSSIQPNECGRSIKQIIPIDLGFVNHDI